MFRLLAIILLLPFVLAAQEYPSGLVFDDAAYAAQSVLSPQTGGKSIPSRVDLSVYCPYSRHQGTIFSCVGWSVGYGALTIERAIQKNWTDKAQITNESSSALFLYNQIKLSDCNRGSRISDALQFLQDKGDCLAKYFDKNLDDCAQTPTPDLVAHAANYKISDYAALFKEEDDADYKILTLRRALAEKKPVVIGLRIRNNFYKLESADFWYPDLGDTTFAGGHAMVIVGYDDNRSAFQLFNSWGTKWGRNGFIWVKYEDLARYVKYAYVIYLGQGKPIELTRAAPGQSGVTAAANVAPAEPKIEEAPLRELSGSFQFMHFSGQFAANGEPIFREAAVQGQKNTYRLAGDWSVGDKFQLHIEPGQVNGYVYALSVDAGGKAEIHWPRNEALNEKFKGEHHSALSPFAGGVVRIPGMTRVMKLSQPGQEFFLILFSEKKIQAPFMHYLRDYLAGAGANLPNKLQEVLGEHQIPASETHFSPDAMQFKAITRNPGAMVPILLSIAVR